MRAATKCLFAANALLVVFSKPILGGRILHPHGNDSLACISENEHLQNFGINKFGGDVTEPWGLWFFLNDDYHFKNFSDLYTCAVVVGNNENTTNTFSCDFSELLEAFHAPCELGGGNRYSVSGSRKCPDLPLPEPTMMHQKFPMCIGPACNVSNKVETITEEWECTSANLEIEEVTTSDVINEDCREEMKVLRADRGMGNPDFASWNDTWFKSYCDNLTLTCDFAPIHQALQGPFEDHGGILYKMSDQTINVETSSGGERMDIALVQRSRLFGIFL